MIRRNRIAVGLALVCLLVLQAGADPQNKRRIFIVSSYHCDYLWSQSTQQGLSEAMLQYGYLDSLSQVGPCGPENGVESSRMIAKKAWMDTKRKNSSFDIAITTERILKEIKEFQPDLVMLGDDNAANYIGNQLLDTNIAVVFWGINGLPLKYGLIDSMDRPGHNVTGIWQAGYYKEGLQLLKRLVPLAKTFAILSCDSVSARPNIKQLQALDKQGKLPLKLVDIVKTNSFEEFKQRTLELEPKVDAFFVLNHDTMHDSR
ncbi:MAG: ABC transporter substrate binding protein [Candidatus Thiodiazotropha sp. L084R]